MKNQIEEIVKKGAKIKKSNPKSIIVLAWMLFAFGLIDYFSNKIGAPGSWIKDAMHGLFVLVMSVVCFTEYNFIKQRKLNLEIIEQLEELKHNISMEKGAGEEEMV